MLTTTDHKVIGGCTWSRPIAWFLAAGVRALVIRSELASPGQGAEADAEAIDELFLTSRPPPRHPGTRSLPEHAKRP